MMTWTPTLEGTRALVAECSARRWLGCNRSGAIRGTEQSTALAKKERPHSGVFGSASNAVGVKLHTRCRLLFACRSSGMASADIVARAGSRSRR